LNLPVVLAVEYKSPSLQDLTLRVALGTVSEAGPSKSRGAGATLGDNNLLSIEFSYALSALPGASVGLGFLYNDLPSNDDDGLAFVGDSGTTVDLWTLILGFKLTGLVAGLTVEGFAAWQGGHEDADVAGISPSREAYALGARAKWEQDSKLSVDWRGELWSGDDDGDLGTESATKKDSETSFDSYRSATRGSIWNGGIETIEGAYGGFVTANYIVTTAGLNYNVTDTFTARAQIGYARLHRALVLNALRTNQLGASLGLGVLWKPVKSVAVDATADFLGASNVARNTLRGTGTYADPASIAQLLLVGVTFSF